jgi:hypothetical protein
LAFKIEPTTTPPRIHQAGEARDDQFSRTGPVLRAFEADNAIHRVFSREAELLLIMLNSYGERGLSSRFAPYQGDQQGTAFPELHWVAGIFTYSQPLVGRPSDRAPFLEA